MTDIKYFTDLYTDFEELARAQPPTRAVRRVGARRAWPVLAAFAVAIVILSAVSVPRLIDEGASQSGSSPASLVGITITASTTPNPPPVGTKRLFTPTLAHPLPFSRRVSLSKAARMFEAPLGLSTVPGMARDDVGPVFGNLTHDGDTGQREVGVAVTYPGVGAVVIYSRPAPSVDANDYRTGIRQAPLLHMSIVAIGGVPALYTPPNGTSVWGQDAAGLSFVKHGTQVTVMIPGATKRQIIAVATSIANRT